MALARGLRERLAALRLTPAQAKLYSQHVRLGLGRPGLQSFGLADARARLEEAQLLLDAALAEREGGTGSEWRSSVKRAGELLEWLAKGGTVGDEFPSAILAAAAYQIAGYPALARGLIITTEPAPGTSTIIRLFLGAQFPELLIEANRAIGELVFNPRPGREAGDRIDHAIVTETLRSLAVIAAAMRWGDEDRLSLAVEKLQSIAALARHSQVLHSGIVAQLCALVARQYSETRLWQGLRSLGAKDGEVAATAYEHFGRKAFLKARSLTWRSQEVGIQRLLAGESFVLCTPTGSGKTTVAELALIGSLFGRVSSPLGRATSGEDDDGALALYLVPSRALAAEVERCLENDLADIGDHRVVVTGLYGGTDWGPTDAWLTSTAPTILVCTYEKAEALLRFLGPLFMKRVRSVIIDEAHSVQFDGKTASLMSADSRALRLEILAIRLLRALDGCRYRLLALSAVTAGLEGSLAQWLVGQDATPARSDHRSTRQLVGRLECLANGEFRIQYDLLDRARLTFEGAHDTPFVPNPFPRHPPAPSFVNEGPLVRLRPYLAWAAFQLAQADANGRSHSVLISITSNITGYAKSLLTLIEADWRDTKLPAFFTPPIDERALRIWTECLSTSRDYFTEASPEYRLLKHGIVVHHGKMPALLARRLKQVIEEGIVRVVMATSTLSEGVNLPVEYILLPDVHRLNGVLSPQEFMNLVGRAGRPGFATEGRTLVLVPPNPGSSRTRAAGSDRRLINGYWEAINSIQRTDADVASLKATSPLAELLLLLRAEWQKLTGDATEQEFMNWLEATPVMMPPNGEPAPAIVCLDTLDAILLAGMEELEQLRSSTTTQEPSEIEDGLRGIWGRSLAKVTAADEAFLARVFLQRGKAIPNLYPNPGERRRIYKTSLPPLSARDLLARIPSIVSHLKGGSTYATWSAEERFQFVEGTLELVSAVPRFAPSKKAGRAMVDWRIVLRWWLDPDGASKTPAPDRVGSWHEYAAANFAYKANWAMGSVTALVLDGIRDGSMPVALSLAEWSKSGLPWIAFWLKELLTWGTLDPVAAFLLARGGSITRAEARTTAHEYYDAQGNEPDFNAILDPGRIRAWAEAARSRRSQPDAASSKAVFNIPARLSAPAQYLTSQRLRVLPRKLDTGGIEWTDIAGYHVATSEGSSVRTEWSAATTDFVLDVAQGTVIVAAYL
jgi:hypothetical protein